MKRLVTWWIIQVTLPLWNKAVSAILCRAYSQRIINSHQLHALSAMFDPTQDGKKMVVSVRPLGPYHKLYRFCCWATVDEACEIKGLPWWKRLFRRILPTPSFPASRSAALVVVLLMPSLASDVRACGRCGFSNCRVNAAYVAPVVQQAVHAQQPQLQILNVVTPTYPHQPLAVQGATAFYSTGQLSAYIQPVDASLHLQQAARLVEQAQQLALKAMPQYTQALSATIAGQQQVEAIRARGAAATAALQAASGRQANTAPKRFTIEIGADGKCKVIQSAAAPKAAEPRKDGDPHPNVIQPQRATINSGMAAVVGKCIACHGPEKQQSGLRLDKPIDLATAFKVLRQVKAGKMPPKSAGTLTAAEKTAIFDHILNGEFK